MPFSGSVSCSRVLLLIATLTGSGCAAVAANHQPTELTRRQAAGQFVCHASDITVRELGNSEVQATGCGKTATWSCSGNTDGHSTPEILDRRCSRISDISSEWGGAATTSKGKSAKGADAPKKSDDTQATAAPAGKEATAGSGQPFPREDVRTTLRAASGGLRSCKDDGAGPTSMSAAIRFEPSGKVSKVDVTPAEGAAASCVRTRLSEIAVSPFTGEPVTVKMPVQL